MSFQCRVVTIVVARRLLFLLLLVVTADVRSFGAEATLALLRLRPVDGLDSVCLAAPDRLPSLRPRRSDDPSSTGTMPPATDDLFMTISFANGKVAPGVKVKWWASLRPGGRVVDAGDVQLLDAERGVSKIKATTLDAATQVAGHVPRWVLVCVKVEAAALGHLDLDVDLEWADDGDGIEGPWIVREGIESWEGHQRLSRLKQIFSLLDADAAVASQAFDVFGRLVLSCYSRVVVVVVSSLVTAVGVGILQLRATRRLFLGKKLV